MDLPPSSLLGRLEAFLPEMEKANLTTEKLAQEGKLEVLDGNLEVAGTDQQREEAEATDEEDEEEGEEGEGEAEVEAGVLPPKTVQLDFALGDFDDTPIAKMEQEKDAETSHPAGEDAIPKDGTEQDEDEECGVAGLVRVPGAGAGAAPREKPRKPLIEEL